MRGVGLSIGVSSSPTDRMDMVGFLAVWTVLLPRAIRVPMSWAVMGLPLDSTVCPLVMSSPWRDTSFHFSIGCLSSMCSPVGFTRSSLATVSAPSGRGVPSAM